MQKSTNARHEERCDNPLCAWGLQGVSGKREGLNGNHHENRSLGVMCMLHQNECACRAGAHACRLHREMEREKEEVEEVEEEEEEMKAMWVCERVACCSAQGYGSQKESVKPGRLQTCDTLRAAQLLQRNYKTDGAM